MSKGKAIVLLILLLIAAVFAYWVWGNFKRVMAQHQAAMGMMGGAAGQAMPVQAARVQRQDVTETYDFTGTTQAVDSIDIRARVAGYLQEIHFTDGSFVDKGQLLFTIEQASYIAARDEAAARLKAAETEQERARLDFERMQQAAKINAVSQQDLSRSQAAYMTAQAVVAQSMAALSRAELDLSYTEIRSPIAGKVSRHLVDAGNLVGAGQQQTLLTTVMQLQPIHVFFYMGEPLLQKPFLQGLLGGGQPVPFTAGLSAESDYPHQGQIRFIDNTVDPLTGTIFVRGELPNEDKSLLPGMFMRVRLPGDVIKSAMLVEEKAIITDLNGKYILVVGKDNMLERRNVKTGMSVGTMRVITQGLTGDEAYAVSSLHMVRPGMPVQPMFGPPAGSAGAQGGAPQPQGDAAQAKPIQQEAK